MSRNTRLRAIWALGLLQLALLVVACQPLIRPPATPVAPAPPYGHLVEIGGRRLFLYCLGEGERTILLEAGLNAGHERWALVQPAAAAYGRVCSYDRAGIGWSDPATTPRTSADVVADLQRLITAAQLPGPYVLAGHSLGALHVRLFADTYPAEVFGLLLVDPVHEDWWSRAAATLPPPAPEEAALVTALRTDLLAVGGDPQANREGVDIAASAAQLRATGDLGLLPLIVLTAGEADLVPAALPAQVRAALVRLWQEELPADLARRTPNAMRLTVPGGGHDLPRQRPDVIVAALKTLVELQP
jgi:pimeloyl-ACP methyl ester carboxylesterase